MDDKMKCFSCKKELTELLQLKMFRFLTCVNKECSRRGVAIIGIEKKEGDGGTGKQGN